MPANSPHAPLPRNNTVFDLKRFPELTEAQTRLGTNGVKYSIRSSRKKHDLRKLAPPVSSSNPTKSNSKKCDRKDLLDIRGILLKAAKSKAASPPMGIFGRKWNAKRHTFKVFKFGAFFKTNAKSLPYRHNSPASKSTQSTADSPCCWDTPYIYASVL